MKIRRNINLYTKDVLDAISDIEEFTRGIENATKLKEDRKTYRAVLQSFGVIGEAMRTLSEEVRENYPEIEWRKIIAMRNLLVHEYWGVDENEVWQSVKKDLPKLKDMILVIQGDFKKISPDTYES